MGRNRKYDSEARVSIKMDTNQKNILNYYTTKLGFPSLSQLIKACINEGLPIVRNKRNGDDSS